MPVAELGHRPPRRMPSLLKIAGYWMSADETHRLLPQLKSHWIGWGEPFCFACGWLAPTPDGVDAWAEVRLSGWMDRAHLVDHAYGGSTHPSNLVPLCLLCHDSMTATGGFIDRAQALAWLNEHESEMFQPALWQVYTDGLGRSRADCSRKAHLLRRRGDYLQHWIGVLQE